MPQVLPAPVDGGGGASTSAQYVTLATDATLTNERVLTAGANVTITDNGAGSTLVVAATGGNAATTVVTEQSFGQSSAVGTSMDYARADHTHGTPATPPAAPVAAQYVTLATDATLTNERVLAVTSGDLTKTDGGAGGNLTLGLATVGTLTPGTYTNATVTVDAKGRVTVATSGTAPVASHPSLTTLGWSAAGHTGTGTSVACFDGSGAAQTVQATADGQVLQRVGGVLVFATMAIAVGLGGTEDRSLDVWYLDKNADVIAVTASAAIGPGSIV